MKEKTYALVVGAGFTGATIAERIASQMNRKVVVVDSRMHIGGNAADVYDTESNLYVNIYGPHVFHTNSKRVWDYVQNFSMWKRYDHYVSALMYGNGRIIKSVPLPINQNSLEILYPATADQWLIDNMFKRFKPNTQVSIDDFLDRVLKDTQNIDEVNMAHDIYNLLYHELYLPYTRNMWGSDVTMEEMKSATGRVPVRFSRENLYFRDRYRGHPKHGYSKLIQRMLTHDNIKLWPGVLDTKAMEEFEFEHLIHTGPIDQFFNYELGRLRWRAMDVMTARSDAEFQETATLNYPRLFGDFIRSSQMNHFYLNSKKPYVVVYEKPVPIIPDNPLVPLHEQTLYPMPISSDRDMYRTYAKHLKEYQKSVPYSLSFVGRQGAYQYMEMGQAIAGALKWFGEFERRIRDMMQSRKN